jgi:hypothetical protein
VVVRICVVCMRLSFLMRWLPFLSGTASLDGLEKRPSRARRNGGLLLPLSRPLRFRLPRHPWTGCALAVPPKKHTLSLGAAPLAFGCPARRGRPKRKDTKRMNTFMSRKQALVQQPPLRRMLSDDYIRIYHRYALRRWRSQRTEYIVRSLKTGQLEPLWVTEDGLIWQGNVRILVLEERGFNVNCLPRCYPPRVEWLKESAPTLSRARLWLLQHGGSAA